MTTSSMATVLPRREFSRPAPGGGDELSNLLVLGGYASDGEPSAALFLWAATRVRGDSETPLHQHRELEILTIVLEGAIGHHDTATERWVDLHAGDAQFIWTGPEISHIEHVVDGRGFQIQFDPGHDVASRQQPSYTDYPVASFTAHPAGDALVTDLIGDGGPIGARTEGLSVRRIQVPAGSHAAVEAGSGRYTLAYMISGAAAVNGARAAADDAVKLNGATSMTIQATAPADLFVVSLPASPSYQPKRMDPRQMGQRRPAPPWQQ